MTTTIYQIYCKDPKITETYIGSTTNFEKRKTRHLNACIDTKHRDYNIFLYEFIRSIGGFKCFDFKILNITNYYDDILRRKQEQCYIDTYTPELNQRNAYLSKEQYEKYKSKYRKKYYEENKEELLKNMKEYRKNNVEHIENKRKDYYKNNKEHINELRRKKYDENREEKKKKMDKYKEKNNEKIKEKKKEWYQKNKERILREKKEIRDSLKNKK